MAEQLDLTVPVVATRANLVVAYLQLDWPGQSIYARLIGSDGAVVPVSWDGAPAVALMVALNKANLTTTSLQKRILQQAVTDGKIAAGTVSGTPT